MKTLDRPKPNKTSPQPGDTVSKATNGQKSFRNGSLTKALEAKLANPATSSKFDLHQATNEVLADVGMSTADSGGKLSFYGQDPILPSAVRFGSMAAAALAAKSVAVAALWRTRTGEGQDISLDVRKAIRRFCGFFEGKWETLNGRSPLGGIGADNPFFGLGTQTPFLGKPATDVMS